MIHGLLGKKVGMTQIFTEDGQRIPVTVIELGPVKVVQKKTVGNDGYDALQVGFEPITSKGKLHKMSKPRRQHFKNVEPMKYLREFKADNVEEAKIGQSYDVSIFSKGQKVDVRGISKGRGFTGVMKRHGFSGGPASHGHRFNRLPGSIGGSATPSRVFKGKKMAGQHGNSKVTIQNLEIVDIKPDLNVILLKGGVPGPNGRVLEVKKSVKSS